MLTVLVIMHSMSVSEKYKRTTASGSDAQTNGAIALYLIERDLRMAGYGIASDEIDGIMAVCSTGVIRAYNQNRSPTDFQFSANNFAPVVIDPSGVPAGDAGSQVLLINYSGTFGMTGEDFAAMLTALTGVTYTLDDYLKAGERVWNLERSFNLKAGFTHADDNLPERLLKCPIKTGASKGEVNRLADMLPEYYKLRGWDEKGVPTAEKLADLALV